MTALMIVGKVQISHDETNPKTFPRVLAFSLTFPDPVFEFAALSISPQKNNNPASVCKCATV